MGRLDEARDAHTKAIELMRAGFGPKHPKTADALGNLAAVEQALGHADVAKQIHQEVLEIRTSTLGPDHASVALALNNLADLEREDGRLDLATTLHTRALKIYTDTSGPQSEGVASTRYYLGRLALEDGRTADAVEHLQSALMVREALGSDASYLGRTRFWLAKAWAANGDDLERARGLARRAATDFESMPGEQYDREVREIRAWLQRRG